MTHFIKSGSRWNVTANANVDIHEALPVGTYVVRQDPQTGQYYLDTTEGFTVSGKLYGDTQSNSDRILATFFDRPNSTGVMLSGEKGSGKTLLGKKLSVDAAEVGIPTIIINQPHWGDNFNSFMQMIDQPTVVFFDEFEKVYDREEQEKMLTLLDGVYPSKKLFILTCNDQYRVDAHMSNRPGRIFYHLNYSGLDIDFIREYCVDNLDDQTQVDSVLRISMLFPKFNFDILKAMVEEMNRYKETPQQALKMLNAKPESGERAEYNFQLRIEGELIPEKDISETFWRGNPLSQTIIMSYKDDTTEKDQYGDFDWKEALFDINDLKNIDAATGQFVFTNKAGDSVMFTKKMLTPYNYDAF